MNVRSLIAILSEFPDHYEVIVSSPEDSVLIPTDANVEQDHGTDEKFVRLNTTDKED